ncbi:adenylate/guanylate cyclase domain-containing protein [Roseivirga pacifica]|uniref:adenylate/guanylate cyclase domain-containing protein n=1 Tax=Roseivirga pacifica TaxID=1267423 RepID=UPI00209496FA|nr:adenylate/guanylate cyclase domain-containing protein [Roseivirga pacifica]MCO6358474.1 2Fe-2S iron-sulfur cluster binding domain-containing protein [Roseivirga pacifica]MCO6369029.1 2Fe-2S iron-sulfur cluster binding domain-containing protein [Roseivirga pacifica]MCO6372267.1 2Fe-2S iron-sulfur cluster binding domain-containing protein [Roseivirga pacifica]MCO6374205.1 2Fe-2S iron-sulfur cluster binding domain-containing protein [Roseivirga pacifica]MCO6380998.1 2Fe-2S iron-sulfur cluster 
MPTIEVVNDCVSLKAEPGKTILASTLDAGIPHAHACGGQALCSTCRIYVEEGSENLCPRNEKETALADQLGLLNEVRLACQTTVSGDVKIRRLVLDEIDEAIILQHGKASAPRSLGVEKDASVLFVDIADYTAFSEKTPAYDIVHILNRYFHIAGNIIKKHKGKIIDYYGDGFLAIFGIDDDPNHAQNLMNAGFELCEAIDKFDIAVHDIINNDFKIRLGAHTGKVIWGTIGIEGMQKEAAIGDTVNLASRIEQANKTLNTRFLISSDLFEKLEGQCRCQESFEIEAKGKREKIRVHSVNRHLVG